jgi:hypothetical protein
MSLLDSIFKQKKDQRRAEIYKDLIHHEAKIGGQLFGKIPDGNRREFFCLDEHTWVWHEEWTDSHGKRQYMMTRYDVRPSGIVKSQGNSSYQRLTPEELKNFYRAVLMYRDRVSSEYDRMLQAA